MTSAVQRTIRRDGLTFSVLDEHPMRPADDPDNFDFWSAYESGAWEPELTQILKDHLSPGGMFVDIGAWVGPVSLLATRFTSEIVAVEPDPHAFRLLSANTSSYKGVKLVNAMIDDHDGTGRVGRKSSGAWGDSMTSAIYDAETIDVPAITIESLFDRYKIGRCDLVKMDIEGYEAEVLAHAARFLAWRVRCPLYVSLHAPLRADRESYWGMLREALGHWSLLVVNGEPTYADDLPDTFDSVLALP